MTRFAGIDLTCFPHNPTAYIVLTDRLTILTPESLNSDAQIITAVERDQPEIVAIDSPLTLPKGLCCLNEACGCRQTLSLKGRQCERELAQIGIGSYFTTKKSIIRPMIERAIRINSELHNKGYHVTEVYPYASKVRLWSKHAPQGVIPCKKRAEGRKFLRERLSKVIPDIGDCRDANHDIFDAVIAAYTAYLSNLGLTDQVGDADEGQIEIPR